MKNIGYDYSRRSNAVHIPEDGFRGSNRSIFQMLLRFPSLDFISMSPQNQALLKGKYASVRPYRDTYGNDGIRLQTWTRVIVNWCIGKLIARDLSLVVS